jgi:hypothetical protein
MGLDLLGCIVAGVLGIVLVGFGVPRLAVLTAANVVPVIVAIVAVVIGIILVLGALTAHLSV